MVTGYGTAGAGTVKNSLGGSGPGTVGATGTTSTGTTAPAPTSQIGEGGSGGSGGGGGYYTSREGQGQRPLTFQHDTLNDSFISTINDLTNARELDAPILH